MSSFIADVNTYNVCTEQEITNILSHFNSDYIFNLIEDVITNRGDYSYTSDLPNIVNSFENYFNQIKESFNSPHDLEQIEDARLSTYADILKLLSKYFNVEINFDVIEDWYFTTYHIYDFLISRHIPNVVNFYVALILKEKNAIYNTLNLNEVKKNKDISLMYNKKIFKNSKLAVINYNMEDVLSLLSGYDVHLNDIIYKTYHNKSISNMLINTMAQLGDFYREQYVSELTHYNISSTVITLIRIELQKVSAPDDININTMLGN